jgi:hypothetical protein
VHVDRMTAQTSNGPCSGGALGGGDPGGSDPRGGRPERGHPSGDPGRVARAGWPGRVAWAGGGAGAQERSVAACRPAAATARNPARSSSSPRPIVDRRTGDERSASSRPSTGTRTSS